MLLAHIEDSISLEIDRGIPELIITGDIYLINRFSEKFIQFVPSFLFTNVLMNLHIIQNIQRQ